MKVVEHVYRVEIITSFGPAADKYITRLTVSKKELKAMSLLYIAQLQAFPMRMLD